MTDDEYAEGISLQSANKILSSLHRDTDGRNQRQPTIIPLH